MLTATATLTGRLARAPVLEFRSMTEFYPGVPANDDVILVLNRGEVLRVPGGHDAGKSTSMNIVSGPTPTQGCWPSSTTAVRFRNSPPPPPRGR